MERVSSHPTTVARRQQPGAIVRFRDLVLLSLPHWRWFVLSFILSQDQTLRCLYCFLFLQYNELLFGLAFLIVC